MSGHGYGEVAASPPVQFPVYGLDAARSGVRWLDGYGDALDDVYLAISGSTGSPDGVVLTRLTDSRAYHFELDQPLHAQVINVSSAAALADSDRPWPQRAELHPDQLRLLPGQS